jgi:hypothetical protein
VCWRYSCGAHHGHDPGCIQADGFFLDLRQIAELNFLVDGRQICRSRLAAERFGPSANLLALSLIVGAVCERG